MTSQIGHVFLSFPKELPSRAWQTRFCSLAKNQVTNCEGRKSLNQAPKFAQNGRQGLPMAKRSAERALFGVYRPNVF